MLWALKDHQRIAPTPKQIAACPGCGGGVRSKCGSIITWHWAHIDARCDFETEPETEWHRKWKAEFPDDWQEVKVGNHRADVRTPLNRVLEIQYSSIDSGTVLERERVYDDMLWVVNAEKFWKQLSIRHKRDEVYDTTRNGVRSCKPWHHTSPVRRFRDWVEYDGPPKIPSEENDLRLNHNYFTFRWKHPRKVWWVAEKPLFLDYGCAKWLFRIEKVYGDVPCGGWGSFVTKADFIENLRLDADAAAAQESERTMSPNFKGFINSCM
jgi:hypothetical protein